MPPATPQVMGGLPALRAAGGGSAPAEPLGTSSVGVGSKETKCMSLPPPAKWKAPAWSGWPYAFSVVLVGACTLVAETIHRVFQTDRVSMIFLASVLIAAVSFGSGPAYLAAFIALGLYNFYLVEPNFTLEFGAPEDFINLVVFLAVAMLTGRLAGRIQEEKGAAETRALTTSALLQASQEFSSSSAEDVLRERLASHLRAATRGQSVVWDGERRWGGVADEALDMVIAAAEAAAGRAVAVHGWRARLLIADGERLGGVAWSGDSAGRGAVSADEARLVDVLVDLGATAIARARLVSAQAEMSAIARAEQLRNALLSSISHDLRTPLASILASVSSLREFGDKFPEPTRADLLLTIQDEAERLNAFVSNLLNMTKLEGGGLVIDDTPFNVVEILGRAVDRQARRSPGKRIEILEAGRDLVARGDPVLFEHALGNVLENAVKFTAAHGVVQITATRSGDRVVVAVADDGPGLPRAQLDAIFEKFYRSPNADPKLQGAGLGLSITRGFTEAMGGAVSARLRPSGGLLVSLELRWETAA